MSPLVIGGLVLSLLVLNGAKMFGPLSVVTNDKANAQSLNQPFKKSARLAYPTPIANPKPISVGASSAIIYDLDSGVKLFDKAGDQRRSIASITKLMTALVIMDAHEPSEVVTVGNIPELGNYDQKIGITWSEKFELIDMMKALLIYSANDAANALAIYDSGSIDAFVGKMNAKASQWGLKNSNFVNPSGLDQGGEYSSANDVLALGGLLYKNPTFKTIVGTSSDQIYNLQGKPYSLATTNKLLGQFGVVGMKTGYTLVSGECLITVAQRDGHSIMTVVLDSPDRFQESKSMIDWSFNNYIWQ